MRALRTRPTRARRTGDRRLPAALATVAVVVTACTGDDAVTPTTTSVAAPATTVAARADDGQLVLGAWLPVTGAGSDLGQPMLDAVDDAVSKINAAGGVLGSEVRLERADEGVNTSLAELLDLGVDAIVGPASSLTALSHLGAAVDPANGVVVCSPSATALALDDFPDNTFFFRTAPSDSLQMAFIAREAQRTGARTVAVGYLDDPYGRGLHDAFTTAMEARRMDIVTAVNFNGDEEDLGPFAATLISQDPGVVVVLGDADDGGRLLAALDAEGTNTQRIIVNDAIRTARATIQSLTPDFRERLLGVAPLAKANGDENAGNFTAHAVDCVNLLALAALVADSDAPRSFRFSIPSVSTGGAGCTTFETCVQLSTSGLDIDYNGASGSAELSNTTGDPVRARFEEFHFDANGLETDSQWSEFGSDQP